MKREIKYRAYDVRSKYMTDILGFKYVGKDKIQVYFLDKDGDQVTCTCDKEQIKLLQSTNLKDKNDIEIYEGDIFHLGDKRILYTVVWHDNGLMGKQKGTLGSYVGLSHWRDKIEIVGNIHENEELDRSWGGKDGENE